MPRKKSRGKGSVDAPQDAPGKAYFNVSAPRALMKRIEELVNQYPELGYTSPSAAAVEGIRRFVVELEEKVAIRDKVKGIDEGPLRMRQQVAHEVILLVQRYLKSEAEAGKIGPS